MHATAWAAAVDVYVTPDGQEFSVGDVEPIITDLQYGFTMDGGAIPAGAFDIRFTQTGTETVAVEQSSVTIDAGRSYVWVVIGKSGSTEQPLTLISVSKPLE